MYCHEKMPRRKQRHAFIVIRAHGIDLVVEKSWALPFGIVGLRSVALINTREIPERTQGYFMQKIPVGSSQLLLTVNSREVLDRPTGIAYKKFPRRFAYVSSHVGLGWHCTGAKIQSACPTRNYTHRVAPDWTVTRNHGYDFYQYRPNTGLNQKNFNRNKRPRTVPENNFPVFGTVGM